MFQFPFGTMHQLNLDWFLQQWQQLRQEWIDEEQHIEDSMQDVYDARDAAIQAKDDAVSAKNDAETAKTAADADALIAEGFAVGEQNGSPVGPGSPYYQVNAKFYSTNAGTYRYLSEAYARGTMGGTPVDPGDAGYEDNAKYYKEQADLDAQSASDDAAFAAADALKAEGYAVGEQNGVPVSSGDPYYEDNAKYYAAACAQDKSDTDTLKDAANAAALRSEGYALGTQNGSAVGSGSPYYENNAYYYFSNTANIDGENAQKMITASEENSTTAAADHAAGSYFRLAGELYQATSDIAIGDTITVGTNCKKDTVGAELEYIVSSGDNGPLWGKFVNKDTTFNIGTPVSFSNSTIRICIPQILIADEDLVISSKGGIQFAVIYVNNSNIVTSSNAWLTSATIAAGSRFAISARRSNNAALSPDEAKNIYFNNDIRTTLNDDITIIYRILANIATVYPDFVANSNLGVNTILLIGTDLYRITASVTQGSTIIPGTNAEKTTISALIKTLLT